jgi:hypothetical protein
MPVAVIGASKNAKAINALLVQYNKLLKTEKLDKVVDVGITKDNGQAFLKAAGEAFKMLVDTRNRIAKPMRGDGTAKAWSKNQANAARLIDAAISAENALLKNLKTRANEVLGIDDDGFRLGGPKHVADSSPPEWIVRLPYFTEQEAPKDISKLTNAWCAI